MWSLLLLWTMVSAVTGEIFTSSLKVERLILEEENVLDELKRYIDLQYDRLKTFSNFYLERTHKTKSQENSRRLKDLQHPNAVYNAIREFSSDFEEVLGESYESFRKILATSRVGLAAGQQDIRGASLSLLRLQSVYGMKAEAMAEGDYLGYQGPGLRGSDTFYIGQVAFSEFMYGSAIDWLNVTATLVSSQDTSGTASSNSLTMGRVVALMGRAYLLNGDVLAAMNLYKEALRLDSSAGDTLELGNELTSSPQGQTLEEPESFHNFSKLCSLHNTIHVPAPHHRAMLCRYRKALLPYYLYKEEIVSVRPHASVIYNFTTDTETQVLKDFVKDKLERGTVGDSNVNSVSAIRTSDLAWIWDHESPVAAGISRRIKQLTGLEVEQNHPEGPASSEAFQVVNYGLGGHYEVHMDPFINKSDLPILKDSGYRIATFLMYLSDVTRGESTVFTRANVAVAPVKNMALFWYNYSPAYERDELTQHGGCPVVIGQKWIANKWIWTSGNTFRRRCGLWPGASQMDIEEDMDIGYL